MMRRTWKVILLLCLAMQWVVIVHADTLPVTSRHPLADGYMLVVRESNDGISLTHHLTFARPGDKGVQVSKIDEFVISPSRNAVVIGTREGNSDKGHLEVWTVSPPLRYRVMQMADGMDYSSPVWSPNGQYLALTSTDFCDDKTKELPDRLILWSLSDNQKIKVMLPTHAGVLKMCASSGAVYPPFWSPHGDDVGVVDKIKGEFLILDATMGKIKKHISIPEYRNTSGTFHDFVLPLVWKNGKIYYKFRDDGREVHGSVSIPD